MFSRIKRFFVDYQKPYTEIGCLIKQNQQEVNKSNTHMFNELCILCTGLLVLMCIIKALGAGSRGLCAAYIPAALIIGIICCVFQLPSMQKHQILGIYLLAVLAFVLTIYLSIVRSPDQRATAFIGIICFVPLCMIDKPSHISVFTLLFFAIHSILAFIVKSPHTALVDTENSLCFALLGLFFGRNSILARLKLMDAQRQLVIDKITDALTGVYNRRKLFDTIGLISNGKSPRPTGVMMMDIDHFKDYNDRFGHCCGDECLQLFGNLLLRMSAKYNVTFYRYGGEEFVCFIYDSTQQEEESLAEEIRMQTKNIKTNYSTITVSIGAVFCDDATITNYETWIKSADEAAYRAKENGRDQVIHC